MVHGLNTDACGRHKLIKKSYMEERIFDISFQCDDRQYKGWVNPSEKTDKDGRPTSYHVVLEGVYFGNLSINNCKWAISEDRPDSLIEAVGHEIEKYYQL